VFDRIGRVRVDEQMSLSRSHRFIDRTGDRQGVLTFIEYDCPKWKCLCVCGQFQYVASGDLSRRNYARCIHNPYPGRPAEYIAYFSARRRCQDTQYDNFHNYGGRGIEFRFKSFAEFFNEIGKRPSSKHSLDRIDVNGHYEPGNVRWATQKEQQRNRTNHRLITYQGETYCVTEWQDRLGVDATILYSRLSRGWCVPCAFTLSRSSRCRHKNLVSAESDSKPDRLTRDEVVKYL